MRIVQVIDSLELNGGSTMFLEMVTAMRRYWDDEIVPFVVSKRGHCGRDGLVHEDLASSYGVGDITVYDYDGFAPIAKQFRDTVIFHHFLGHTKSIKFHKSCKYIVVIHTVTNLKRLLNFNASLILCVCKYFKNSLRMSTRTKNLSPATIVLNGCEDYFHIEPETKEKNLIGRCQRVVPTKFRKDTVQIITSRGYKHCLMGPDIPAGMKKDTLFFGPIFDKNKKLPIIKSFRFYLHDVLRAEGASMAVLEALSCGVPVLARNVGGGLLEIIKNGKNGYLFRSNKDLLKILKAMTEKNYRELQEQVRSDFENRLHIRHPLKEYKRIIEDV